MLHCFKSWGEVAWRTAIGVLRCNDMSQYIGQTGRAAPGYIRRVCKGETEYRANLLSYVPNSVRYPSADTLFDTLFRPLARH